ncbi:MAG: efflux RND transporter periplasmic adaptor subunit [Hyphomicrobiaceae bacterium]|jgi:membrane fusion protein (multidrug efflux system)
MKRRFFITSVVILLLLGGLGYFQFVFKPQMIRTFLSQMKSPPVTVTAEPTRVERWIERLASIGTLIASQGVEVTSQVAGIVTEVLIDSGKEVPQGTKLVQLDTAVELADLDNAVAVQREAELAYERQADLMQKRVTSEANLDTARAKREVAGAAVKRIQAVIAQKAIASPFAGRLGIRKVEKGQYVSAGMALVSLQALDPIRADFPMPEQYVGKLAVGQPIELTVDAYPGQVFKGEIQSLDARVAQDTRTLLVRGLLPNPERKLLPGMFANVTVLVGDPRDVVTVPRTAVTYSLYGDSVYVVKPAPAGDAAPPAAGSAAAAAPSQPAAPALVVERRFVRTGQVRDDRVAVTFGLEAGENVVTTGQLKLNPGASVLIDNSQTPKPAEDRPKQ